MNILSLFDGQSCGRIALQKAGIKVDKYYASEIDKHAIKVSRDNWPDIIQIGDVKTVSAQNLPRIDLLIGGSPCQGFSFAGKQLNFEDERSKLFFEYVRVLRETKPTYFLLENVNMLQKHQDVISEFLKVKPVFINSRLVTAQDRKRLYWTNIPYFGPPKDRNIGWQDITDTPGSFAAAMRGRRINENGVRDDYAKIPIVQYLECRKDNKTNCLTTVGKDNIVVFEKKGRQPLNGTEYRYLTRNELEKLQNLPINYTKAVSYNQANRMCGNGWTIDIIVHLLQSLLAVDIL